MQESSYDYPSSTHDETSVRELPDIELCHSTTRSIHDAASHLSVREPPQNKQNVGQLILHERERHDIKLDIVSEASIYEVLTTRIPDLGESHYSLWAVVCECEWCLASHVASVKLGD
jgi:hypothetical protein